MPQIKLSDKQLPKIPTHDELATLVALAGRATPGKRIVHDIAKDTPAAHGNFQLRTQMGDLPLGRHDAELAAAMDPDVVMGLLYKINLLEQARDKLAKLMMPLIKTDPAAQTLVLELWKQGEAPST